VDKTSQELAVERGRSISKEHETLISELLKREKLPPRVQELGLEINPGVTFFKKKWGGVFFLSHTLCLYEPSSKGDMDSLLRKL